MNIREYIESGNLELYVANVLSTSEKDEVEMYMKLHPEINQEMQLIEKAFQDYAFAHEKKPSNLVFENILQTIDKGKGKITQPKIISLNAQSKNSPFLKYIAYAATALLFISGALNIFYYNRYRTVQDDLISLQGEKTFLADEFSTMKANYDLQASEIDIFKNSNNFTITLKGSALDPAAIATVIWNQSEGTVYMNAQNLPTPPSGKQYQLWALKDGKPIDAGVFNLNHDLQKMRLITDADAFAVTLEPIGGSINPTLELLYVIGNV